MKLGEIACVHTNMSLADFWIVRSGPNIGMVVDAFDRGHIGVMFKADAVFKKCVMPNKFKLWFSMMHRVTGPILSTVKEVKGTKEVCPALMRNLRLPSGASLHGSTTS
jgi:hypothetical protein